MTRLREEMNAEFADRPSNWVHESCDRCLPEFFKENRLQRVRVNKITREQYSVEKGIVSNSIIIVEKVKEPQAMGELKEMPQEEKNTDISRVDMRGHLRDLYGKISFAVRNAYKGLRQPL